MQTTRDNARFLRGEKNAHYLVPVLGNQPSLYATLDALDWENTPVAAATIDTARGRIETRTIRVLPAPEGTDFPGAEQAVLIERYVTVKKNGTWVMRNCEAVLYINQPHRRRRQSRRPPGPRPRPLDGGAPALATRRDLGRGQIPPPHRQRPPGDVRYHQPRHHPLPDTRSNQVQGGNPP
jgi:hypothetical protein